MLDLTSYPVPVSVLPDEREYDTYFLIHRDLPIQHRDNEQCPCRPHLYTAEEILLRTTDELLTELNALDAVARQ